MLERDRLIPFITDKRLIGFMTFYICFDGDENKYIRDDPWIVLEDNESGDVCYIDQLITDKHKDNAKMSYLIWHNFKKYIKEKFPNVKKIKWSRYKKDWGKPKLRSKEWSI